ncbi:hypothetical protein MLD38_022402 [Melastoma candidum]|uniref:Uncharacterized protein n=1 Tax=Melastoma candidum TaxID=119954 RepID=A0ACB9QJ52_9MYRT|nr:hypothetical protein MLD38_022402 [Melastoma candidum]
MLFPGDLGFSSPAAVLLSLVLSSLAIPLFFLLLRRRWEFSVARNEEVRRLLESASEEAARAEIEALRDWWSGTAEPTVAGSGPELGSEDGYYCCAVCYSPTTTRCSRCKVLRYCSGKCQIVHWRRGHREECHPPEGRGEFHGNTLMSGLNVRSGQIIGNLAGDPRDESMMRLVNQCGSGELGSAGVFVDEEKKLVESPASSPLSGFSSSVRSSESSDDLSACESFGSDDSGKSFMPLSAEITDEASQPTCSAEIADKDARCSPKFSILVDAVESFKDSGELGDSKDANEGCVVSSLNRQSSLHGNLLDSSGNLTSGFWRTNLDSNEQKRPINDYSSNGSTGTAGGFATSDSKSVPNFSFSFSEDIFGSIQRREPKNTPASLADNLDNTINNGSAGSTKIRSRDFESLRSRTLDVEGFSSLPPSSSLDTSHATNSSTKIHVMDVKNMDFQKPKLREGGYTTSSIASHAAHNVRHLDSRFKEGKSTDRLPSVKNSLKSSVWRVLDQFKGSVLARHHQAVHGSDTSERDNVKVLAYNSFTKLYAQNGLLLLPCGLVNCGNSCYANVVLQCLAFTPPLTAYFLQGLHSEACSQRDWCFTCEFERLVLKFKEGKSPVSPLGIVSHLRNIGIQLGNGREEDAHEFLRCAIDRMQSDFLMANRKKAAGSNEEEMTLVGLTFGGYLRSKIRCLRCNGKTEQQERLMDLTVEIEGDIGTLEEALRRFTGSETLDGENKYQCSRCKTYEKARKKLTVLEAPNILTIAFKRYQSGKFAKLSKEIRFSEIIDLASFMDGWKSGPAAYRLYGVIVHLDVMSSAFSGHYVCYVRNSQDKWFKIDDSTVKPVELGQVLMEGAYMLLYARCSPQAPRLIRDRSSHHDSKHPGAKSSRSKTPGDLDSYPSTTYAKDAINHEYSSNSDESSYSTSSTQDSSSYDDYIFGEFGDCWTSSPWSNSSYSHNSPHAISR